MHRAKRPWFSSWNLLFLILVAIFSVPLLVVLGSVFIPNGEIWQHLRETLLADYVTNSLLLMLGVGVITLIIGVVCAWLVTMFHFPFCRMFEWALLLPMSIPAYIIAYTYTGVLDTGGPLQNWIREFFDLQFGEYWFPEIRSLTGAMCMLSLVLYPYVYLLTRASFLEQSVCVLEVSRTLGCGLLRSFFRIGIALARPAIIVGLSLVMMETLADYGTVQYFGVPTFTTGIFRVWFGLDDSLGAAQLSAFMLIFVAILLLFEYRSRRYSRFYHTSSRYLYVNRLSLPPVKAMGAFFMCLVPFLFGFIIPFFFLAQWAIHTYPLVLDDEFTQLIENSVTLAIITAVLAVMLSLFMAYSKRLSHSNLTKLVVRFIGMGYALPGSVIAIGVLLSFAWGDHYLDMLVSHYLGVNSGLLLSGTMIAVVFGYLVRFLSISLNTINAALLKIKPSMDDAARNMGLKDLLILKRIHIPMIRGSVLTGALLVFVDVLKELPATLILRPFNYNTLAIQAYELANEERLAEAACPALAIVLVSVIPVVLLSRSISRSQPRVYAINQGR